MVVKKEIRQIPEALLSADLISTVSVNSKSDPCIPMYPIQKQGLRRTPSEGTTEALHVHLWHLASSEDPTEVWGAQLLLPPEGGGESSLISVVLLNCGFT